MIILNKEAKPIGNGIYQVGKKHFFIEHSNGNSVLLQYKRLICYDCRFSLPKYKMCYLEDIDTNALEALSEEINYIQYLIEEVKDRLNEYQQAP